MLEDLRRMFLCKLTSWRNLEAQIPSRIVTVRSFSQICNERNSYSVLLKFQLCFHTRHDLRKELYDVTREFVISELRWMWGFT